MVYATHIHTHSKPKRTSLTAYFNDEEFQKIRNASDRCMLSDTIIERNIDNGNVTFKTVDVLRFNGCIKNLFGPKVSERFTMFEENNKKKK